MTVREVAHGTPEYDALVALRRRVLRVPLGLDFTPEELEEEASQRHFGLYPNAGEVGEPSGGTEPVAVCVLMPADGYAKVRQVAVAPEAQGRGCGAALMRAVEAHALEIVLHARESAVPFYLRLGYELQGEPFEEVGILHRRMRKRRGTVDEPVSS